MVLIAGYSPLQRDALPALIRPVSSSDRFCYHDLGRPGGPGANEDLVKAFLDVPEFKEMVEAAVLAEVYEKAGS